MLPTFGPMHLNLVRAGPGAPATPEDLLRYIDDDIVIEHAFEVPLPSGRQSVLSMISVV